MAEALGWPNAQIGYADILKLAQDPAGWGGKGHPEWGPFRLGKTNPNFSTSGLSALVDELGDDDWQGQWDLHVMASMRLMRAGTSLGRLPAVVPLTPTLTEMVTLT